MATAEVLVKGRLTNFGQKEFKNDDGTVFSRNVATLVFDKEEFKSSIEAMVGAVKKAMLEEFGKEVNPTHKVFKDGDKETRDDKDPTSPTFGQTVLIADDSPHLKNSIYMTNLNADRCVVYDTKAKPMTVEEVMNGDGDVYVGCYVQAKMAFSVYANKFGIQCTKYLNAMTLLKDGEKIGSRRGDSSAEGFEFVASTKDQQVLENTGSGLLDGLI